MLGSRYRNGKVTVVNWPIARLILSYFANVYARAVTGLPVASFATRGDRNSPRTKRGLNTSAGKIGAMIRLVIRNSDSPFRRCAIYIGHRPPSARRD